MGVKIIINDLSKLIDPSIVVKSFSFYFDIGFIHTPRSRDGLFLDLTLCTKTGANLVTQRLFWLWPYLQPFQLLRAGSVQPDRWQLKSAGQLN